MDNITKAVQDAMMDARGAVFLARAKAARASVGGRPHPTLAAKFTHARKYVEDADRAMAEGRHIDAWRAAIRSLEFTIGVNGDDYESQPQPPSLTIAPGTYRLKRDVPNPEADRRRTSPWAADIIPEDTRIEVLDLTVARGYVALFIDHSDVAARGPIAQAVIPHLFKTEDDYDSVMFRLTNGAENTRLPNMLLEQLVANGTVKLADIEKANDQVQSD